MPLVGIFKTLHVMLFFLAMSFASAVRQLQKIADDQEKAPPMAAPHYEVQHLSKRWRAERNMWLAAFAFTLWAVLAAFYRELAKRMNAEERLIEIEMSMDGYTADTTREVSSKPRDLLSPRSVHQSPVKVSQSHTPPPDINEESSATIPYLSLKAAKSKAPETEPKDQELSSMQFVKKDQ